ncbi:hypothetical protein N657DRAFT_682324 [Parathielavia appendiculata]|uniref:Uncharacterized protein n=1 Tax=Parathielavia appendiculata TaxID=2587402 RepID=A0AAN6TW75_9PEZI|nr:hypothetical protein N657DRAFT_682324 [Parathielavia appendiculata]
MSSTASFRQRLQIQTTMSPRPWPGGGAVSPEQQQHRSPVPSRPPLSPRCYSATAVTGQSRFVEGSMNDRVSAAPPPGFLGHDEDTGAWEVQGQQQEGAGEQARDNGSSARYHLRRPRSTAAWAVGSSSSGMGNQVSKEQQGQQQQQRRGGVTKKSSFLAPLWDGVREKLHLSKSKSSGSIGRVVNSVVSGGANGGGEGRMEKEGAPVGGAEDRAKMPPPSTTAGYPSREEVLESYKNLVASGFFEAHAIRGGRHPPRTGGNGPALEQGRSFVEHMGTMSSPGAKSFADHMAAQQQHRPALPLSSPTRPPPPPRISSQGKSNTAPSPQRGTKRGASIDLAGDAEMVTRKLVKKLRYSASRLSMDLPMVREKRTSHYSSYGTVRSRPSTSSNVPGPLSPTSSVFSGITPSLAHQPLPTADDTMSTRHGKITKPKDDRPRRILRLGRRQHRAPEPATTTDAVTDDPDAMVIDEPTTSTIVTEQRHPKTQLRKVTPPPAAFRSTHHHPRGGLRSSSTSSSVMSIDREHDEHGQEPLSIVPDPNQGIPFVPRIPKEFCEAMADLVPSASAAVVVVVPPGETIEDGMAKNGNRDSGLGEEDVENLPRAAQAAHGNISLSLYDKALDYQGQLTEEECQLFLRRGDVPDKALAYPDILTTDEIHETCAWPPPDVVRANIQRATDGMLSTPAELFARAKDVHDHGRFDTDISDDKACLISQNFYAGDDYFPSRRMAPHGIPSLRITLNITYGAPKELGLSGSGLPQPSSTATATPQDQASQEQAACEFNDALASVQEQYRLDTLSEKNSWPVCAAYSMLCELPISAVVSHFQTPTRPPWLSRTRCPAALAIRHGRLGSLARRVPVFRRFPPLQQDIGLSGTGYEAAPG